MSVSVTLPALGESVTEGTVTRWLKAEGERVEADEPLLEVSTDKVDTEIPAPAAGILASIKVAEDETVEIGAELAIIDDGSGGGSEAAAPAAEETPAAPAQEAPAQEAPAAEAPKQEEAPQAAPAEAPAAGGSAEGTDVTLPALGESVTEGTVTRWLKEVGEEVSEDEPLLEVSTDKVDTEIPAPVSGVLLEIVVAEDETAEVGAKLAVIGAKGAAPAAAPAAAAPAPAQEAPKQEAPKQEAPKETPAAPDPAPAAAPAAPTQAQTPPATVATPAPAAPAAPAPAAAKAPAPAATSGDDSAYVTPLVRKLATENGVDLGQVK
ncbi:biotin/lipoyl-containing protein, partial [Streptomyces sp. NPDC091272]|uniref:biotin/lipoyl-containing protein n=1 Tax=Streptomyces sp. NPDC091272 TaxID=3365981 RepID=UPI0038297F95